MNTDFLIEENSLECAHDICKFITNDDIRNRAVANVFAANIAKRFFEGINCQLDITSGLHNIPKVLDDIDVADIYVNNAYIDVRLFFEDEELGVPKSHFERNLLPLAYMFIKVTPDLSGATVVGFILPEDVEKNIDVSNFYPINESSLISFYDLESRLVNVEDSYSISENQIYSFLDGTLGDVNSFYRELLKSQDGRLRLAKAAKAQYVFNFVSLVADDSVAENSVIDESFLEENLDDNIDTLDELDIVDDLEGDSSLVEDLSDGIDELLPDSTVDELSLEVNDDLALEENSVEDFSGGIQDDVFNQKINENSLEELELSDNKEEQNVDALDFIEDVNDEQDIIDVNKDGISSLEVDDSIDKEQESDIDSYSFTTVASPSLDSLSDNLDNLLNDEDNKDASLGIHDNDLKEEFIEEEKNDIVEVAENRDNNDSREQNYNQDTIDESVSEGRNFIDNSESQEQIETLFNNEDEITEETLPDVTNKKTNSSLSILLLLALLAVIGSVGYFVYNKIYTPQPIEDDNTTPSLVAEDNKQNNQKMNAVEDAMPIETVEKINSSDLTMNEGNSVSIPAIEQNLDASILVSNLKIEWEVPAGYASNTTARRYLTKLGKIIQLNLKTELLLLNKPPITNKITVNIKFNDSSRKFEAVGILNSSGEKSVDDLIMQTINKALAMNLNINTDSFGKLQGNPVLIIHL